MGFVYIKKEYSPPKLFALIYKKIFALIFFGIGIILLSSALYPILSYQLQYSTRFSRIIDPVSSNLYIEHNILGENNQSGIDYSQLSNWFANSEKILKSSMNIDYSVSNYYLTIPKLKIEKAEVVNNSQDLKKSLVQYPKTAPPGQSGNTVIIGHSVLPQFFNPKSYMTIFSTLFKLKQGDEIVIDYDNNQYRYLVEEMFEVKPTELSVLEQQFDGKHLTLITCSPPGTYLRRLIIKAKIVE